MKLNLLTPINPLGYGVAGHNIAEALLEQNVDLHTHLIGQLQNPVSEELFRSTEDAIGHHDPSRPLVKIWHQHDLINRIGNKKYYGFPIFELDRFSNQEICHLRVPDELIVCSEWAKGIVNTHLDTKTSVVPLGVNRTIFNELPRIQPPRTTYKFFTIGKLEYRKGHDFIVQCFSKAFELTDDVELHMMVNNPFLPPEITQQWYGNFKNSKMGSKITFYNPVDTHTQVSDFMHSCDCGLFVARAEGWNLELLESMSCGKPVIATNYSAHTEYCNGGNAYLIDITDTEEAHDRMGGMWFRGQGNWAELDYDQEEQMIRHMRYCYENRPSNPQGVETAKEFTWENSAKKLIELL